ncbi:hypothetical protein CAFE_17320 [Caprobacter fermentans]|uniref:Uncharacterized protein n=1 Tax=Caproicibacter fermentans TaxID=2576756 RepID=A0A6N8HZT3_9FIRM|nr:hypothetical protein [Caproicibacter fermentans]OCN01729.1 hypothetical protein A7X67_01165 [Clostridium sp. W14A]
MQAVKNDKKIKVGIGFATGRKSFQKVLKTYVYNWKEYGLTENEDVSLNLLVAYDLKYSNAKPIHFTGIHKDLLNLIDEAHFIGRGALRKEIAALVEQNVLSQKEADLFFGSGYAAKRNAILYKAVKSGIDYLVFLDDDEYPFAVTNTHKSAVWGGQAVLTTHLDYIRRADITNGYHCGYISPIPYIRFNKILTESDFRVFIEAISNDVLNWDSLRAVMNNGGVTYADPSVLVNRTVEEVPEINRAKFITGANLCLNLTRPERVFPFYNPPGARGEDTFLSTCLSDRKVLRVPCYAFHDGFSTYQHLMDGVLPNKLKRIEADSEPVVSRFYAACLGWVRYKPLFVYITQRDQYDQIMRETQEKLSRTLPKICAYFQNNSFMKISSELNSYRKNVEKHYAQFLEMQRIWAKLRAYLKEPPARRCFKVSPLAAASPECYPEKKSVHRIERTGAVR